MESNYSFDEIVVVRQRMTTKEAFPESNPYNPEQEWDYLTIYNPGGEVIARSNGYAKTCDIYITYRGVVFMAKPGSGEECCFAQWKSLVDVVQS